MNQTIMSLKQNTCAIFSKHWLKFVVLLIVIFITYYIYANYINQTTYCATREGLENNEEKQATLMYFYVDWCPHCKTAKPEWDSLKTEYEGKQINGYNMKFIEYNCTTETPETEELMNKYKIEGYPTIKLLKDNQVIEYDAKPTKATMSQFLTTVL
jgi:thiol-disulfide isomerase/thioredoxin